MQRVFFPRVFLTSPNLIEMFALRAAGVPILTLAQRFHRDRKTIRYHLVRHQILPFSPELCEHNREFFRHPKPKKLRVNYIVDVENPINKGKTYLEYLEEARLRKIARSHPAV